jgi:riboflavin synthase
VFTGLVQDIGEVTARHDGALTELWINTRLGASELTLGESIAVDGACLTVVEAKADAFRVQASSETLARTTLGTLTPGAKVNLERAMRLSDRLGGHMVLGHVDATARIRTRKPEGDCLHLSVELPASLAKFFIEKGSVTVDGVSLTVNSLGERDEAFNLLLIPETIQRTTLAEKRPGDYVNLEADVIGKYVARLWQQGEPRK